MHVLMQDSAGDNDESLAEEAKSAFAELAENAWHTAKVSR